MGKYRTLTTSAWNICKVISALFLLLFGAISYIVDTWGENLISINMYKVTGNLGYYNPSQPFPTLKLKWEKNSCFISAGVQLLYSIGEFREFFVSRRFKDTSSKL